MTEKNSTPTDQFIKALNETPEDIGPYRSYTVRRISSFLSAKFLGDGKYGPLEWHDTFRCCLCNQTWERYRMAHPVSLCENSPNHPMRSPHTFKAVTR